MLKRALEKYIHEYLDSSSHKIFFMWGPRRSGKTTLLQLVANKHNVPVFNFDLISDRELFVATEESLSKLASAHSLILIDEIQNHPQSTVALKILHDHFNVKIIATGSSELRQKGADFDSLAGRFDEHYCLPFSAFEIVDDQKALAYQEQDLVKKLHREIQIFGAYPEVFTATSLSESQKIDLLQNMLDTYVLKDVINIYDLKNEKLAKDILTKIALQIGSEVSVREIANSLQANVTTVASYIEIFIKNYILIPLPSFKTNARRAVSENRKLYFYDLGLRNILVKDFRPLELRPDRGGVFENFIIAEIEKRRKILHAHRNLYFYREYGGQEVDLVVEDYQKQYACVEIKVHARVIAKKVFPLPHDLTLMTADNYLDEIKQLLPTNPLHN